jgi:membrane fusion protein, multidrug efflux system
VAQKESDAADYASSQAHLEQTATANLLQAKANVAAKRATNERAQSDLERYTPLLATGDVSKFQFDAVDAAARVAKSEREAAEQQLIAAQQAVDIARANTNSSKARLARSQSQLLETKARERQVPITEATYKSAVANVERAKATLEKAQLNLAYTTIQAPITGQVTQLSVHLGQHVSPGELLFTIVPLHLVYVTANFKETQLAHVRPGQRARIHVDTYEDNFQGIVDSIAGATGSRQALLPPQNATGNFIKVVQRIPVKILVKPAKDRQQILRPGMNVEATIYTRSPMSATTKTAADYSTVFLRLALGLAFLSAVADRFGLWGGYGQPHVAWGDFARFIAYTGKLNWFYQRHCFRRWPGSLGHS